MARTKRLMAKSCGGRLPPRMKMGRKKPSPGKPTPKQQFQVSKGGPTPGKSPAKNFASPKQASNFQTSKQTPKTQTSVKKLQTLGKEVSTPHPMKKLAEPDEGDEESDSEEDDEEMDSDESFEDESDEANGSLHRQKRQGPMSGKQAAGAKKGQPVSQPRQVKKEARSDEDEEGEKVEEDDDEGAARTSSKPNVQPQKKLKAKDGSAVAVQAKTVKTEEPEPIRMPPKPDKKLQDEMEERRRERDRRSLFIKNLPRGTTDEEIKALSSDIGYVKRKSKWRTWCWVSFANEQVCQKNYEKLKNGNLGNAQLFVDFCGEKSQSGPPKQNLSELRVDALRLYVGSMPSNTTEADLKRLFPTATYVHYRPDRTFAFINYDTPEKARQAFENGKDAKINGSRVVVAFARMPSMERKPDAVKKFAKDQASGKAVKVEAKMECI